MKFETATDEPPEKNEKKKKSKQTKTETTAATKTEKKKSKQTTTTKASAAKTKTTLDHPTGKEDAHITAQPAKQFPAEWTVRHIPRSNSNRTDAWYYSPKEDYRFRNAGDVKRFLQKLDEVNGDEKAALLLYKKGKTTTEKNTGATAKTTRDHPTGKEDAHIPSQPAKHKEAPEKIEKKKKSKQTKGTPKARPHPTGKEDAHIPSQPDTQFPPGWTVRRIPRPKGKQRDTRYYSPIEDYKFKTKKEVKLFLQKLDEANGDEKAALVLFKKKDDVKMKDGKTTPQDEDGYLSSPITV